MFTNWLATMSEDHAAALLREMESASLQMPPNTPVDPAVLDLLMIEMHEFSVRFDRELRTRTAEVRAARDRQTGPA